MIRGFPVASRVDGWNFRILEVSEGKFLVEGKSFYGRQVSRSGIAASYKFFQECMDFALSANESIDEPQNNAVEATSICPPQFTVLQTNENFDCFWRGSSEDLGRYE
jgi:hypothetical protein